MKNWNKLDEKTLAEIQAEGDSIILPGSWCDAATGVPIGALLERCRMEFWLKEEMRHKCTIATGGARGVKTYRTQVPCATEAGQIIEYAVSQGQDRTRYVREDFALDTLGNLIFSTKTMLQAGLYCPVFLGQDEQIVRLKLVVNHWYGRSRIQPLFAVCDEPRLESPGSDPSLQRIKDDIRRAALRDHQGLHFLEYFKQGIVPLPSHKWDACKWSLEVAIRWLFRHAKERDGTLRYPAMFDLDEVLAQFLA